ncbi:hypothetical protein IFR05_004576 [Cadophora sp. M221]|nr:hypothetical protein IFR05_004576 [Cadophora sp. M221]
MGGIVVKKALTICVMEAKRYSNVLSSTDSILFLATPHRGSKPADMLATVAKLSNLPLPTRLMGRTRHELVAALGRDSTSLFETSRQFRDLTDRVKIYSFIEQRIIPPASELIVDKHSGSLNCAGEVVMEMSGCDHRTICRFQSDRSEDYMTVLGILQERAEVVTTRKSTLMAFLHNHFATTHPRDIHISFFFHGNGTSLQKSQLGMFRSLIHQLYKWSPSARKLIFAAYDDKVKECGEYGKQWEWQVEELRRLLSEILSLKPLRGEEIIIFVDALDEVSDQGDMLVAGELVGYFHELNDMIVATGRTTRICISCRHYPTVAANQGLVINVEEWNARDVARYVEYQLRIGVEGWGFEDEGARRALEHAIVKKAQGVFLWARLRVPKIVKNLNDGVCSLVKAPGLLEDESNELFTQYEAILSNDISAPLRAKASQLLQWICLAERPLSITELRFALACNEGSSIPDLKGCENSRDFVDSDERMKRLTKSLSGGLAEVRGSTVQLFHQTVKDFLRNQGLRSLLKPTVDGLSNEQVIGVCEDNLARSCLAYLSFQEMLERATEAPENMENQFAFLQYATKYWILHSERAERHGTTQEYIVEKLESHPVIFDVWKTLYHSVYQKDWRTRPHKDAGLIFVAASFNLQTVVYFLLQRNSSLVASTDESGDTPLHYAAREGHEQMVWMLVDFHADIEATNRWMSTPLESAAANGHEGIVKFLLQEGADINKPTGSTGTALHAAAVNGNPRLVNFLLRSGAGIDAQGSHMGTALHEAANWGHEQVVKLLIDKGAEINVIAGNYGSALQAATQASGSDENCERIVKLLLDEGADVNEQSGQLGNALQAAATTHNSRLVELLLAGGANINAQGGEYWTALQGAAFTGSEDIVKLLLDSGAEVNIQGGYFGTALHAAPPNQEKVRMLLDKGARVDLKGGKYGNVLQAAAVSGSEELVRLFLDKGADINEEGGEYGHVLQAAVPLCNESCIRYLLDSGANLKIQGGKYGSALRAAITWKREAIVKVLLQRGADPNEMVGGSGMSALYLAASKGHVNIVETLLNHGANINLRSSWSGTALNAAIHHRNKDVVVLLLDRGAISDAQGEMYESAIEAAEGDTIITKILVVKRRKLEADRGKLQPEDINVDLAQ